MQSTLLAQVARLVPAMAEAAPMLDETAAFPIDDMAALAEMGALAAPLPRAAGGIGLGTEPAGANAAAAVLECLGGGNLAVGRLYEAHVNALRLIVRYGTPDALQSAARDVGAGSLFALWVTDPPLGGLIWADGALRGGKQFCSGAGHVRRAVVTACGEDGLTRLAIATLDGGAIVTKLAGGLSGMRAATTGQVAFDGVAARLFGAPGDYLREPDFSAGAWRTSAVTAGGLAALLKEASRQLRARGRSGDPHQQARMGQAFIAGETARLWVTEAAGRAEDPAAEPAATVAYVNLARIAVEQACLDAITLVQRSLGAAAFVRPNPVERMCRDLATYLRQPAADMVLTEAAAHWMAA